jgi:hypothetical protein
MKKSNRLILQLNLDTATGKYTLTLNTKKDKHLFFDIGGNLSNRPISNFFLAVQYNHVGRDWIYSLC